MMHYRLIGSKALSFFGLSASLAAAACAPSPAADVTGGASSSGDASGSTSASTGGESSTGESSTSSGGAAAVAEGELPVRIDYLPEGGLVFVSKVTVGGTEFEAVLDTGSSGLRIFPGVIKDSDLASTSAVNVSVIYGGAVVAKGPVATAKVTLAGLTTPQPIPVHLIDSVACTVDVPNCAAQGKDASSYTFNGYRAILGIGMRNTPVGDVGNPVVQLSGHPASVVSIKGGFGATAGVLIIGPTPEQKAKFATVKLPTFGDGNPLADGTPTFDDRTNNVCIVDKTGSTSYCAPALLDTGGQVTKVMWPQYTGAPSLLPAGDSVDVQIHASSDPASALLGDYQFVVGTATKVGLDRVRIEPTSSNSGSINTGPQLFFHYQVLLDQMNGLEGIAPY